MWIINIKTESWDLNMNLGTKCVKLIWGFAKTWKKMFLQQIAKLNLKFEHKIKRKRNKVECWTCVGNQGLTLLYQIHKRKINCR